MVRYIYARKGFTLIELLIAAAIMLLIIGGAMAIYLMSITAWKEGSVQIALQRKVSMATEKMVRGVDGTNGIREATSVGLYSSNTEIQYKSGIDDLTRRFYLNSGKIWYDSDTSPGGGDCIAENVTGLTFSVSGNIVTIELSLMDEVIDKDINIDLVTKIKLRN